MTTPWIVAGEMKNGISIHTPTQGVTQKIEAVETNDLVISIHTPTQGVTKFVKYSIVNR